MHIKVDFEIIKKCQFLCRDECVKLSGDFLEFELKLNFKKVKANLDDLVGEGWGRVLLEFIVQSQK